MASIRVNSGALKIEVNDKGDTISLYKDMDFVNGIKGVLEYFKELGAEADKHIASLSDDDADAVFDIYFSIHKSMHDAVEEVFGQGTCMKVFGDGEVDVIPSMSAFKEFFDQIGPYVLKVTEEVLALPKDYQKKVSKPEVQFRPKGYMGGAPEDTFTKFRLQLDSSSEEDKNEV